MGNQRKLILYTAVSLDGFIAKEDDSLDWLFKVEGEGDNGYSDFYETVDTILMGRRTYEQILALENGQFPYQNKDCYVFSRSENLDNEHVKFISGDLIHFTNSLINESGKNIWLVGGGDLLHTFLKEKLIDQLILTITPSIIGTGIPLFKDLSNEIELKLVDIKRFNQFAELIYEVKK